MSRNLAAQVFLIIVGQLEEMLAEPDFTCLGIAMDDYILIDDEMMPYWVRIFE